MYNSEIKEQFLSEYSANYGSVNGIIRSFFEKTEAVERLLSSDIAEMTKSEVISAINQSDFLEMSTAEVALSVSKSYYSWCVHNNIFSSSGDGLFRVTLDDIDPSSYMSKALFRDERDFLYSMRKVREFDGLYNEVVALVLSWLGLSISEIMSIHEDGVNFDERKVYARDGSILVPWFSDEFAEVLMLYKRTKSATRQNATTVYEVIKDLSYDGFMKRVCSPNSDKLGTALPARQISSAIDRMNHQYADLGFDPRFSMRNAQRCGGLNRLFSLEQSGISVDDKKNAAVVEKTYGSKQYRRIRWQYKYYKKAFNL